MIALNEWRDYKVHESIKNKEEKEMIKKLLKIPVAVTDGRGSQLVQVVMMVEAGVSVAVATVKVAVLVVVMVVVLW